MQATARFFGDFPPTQGGENENISVVSVVMHLVTAFRSRKAIRKTWGTAGYGGKLWLLLVVLLSRLGL